MSPEEIQVQKMMAAALRGEQMRAAQQEREAGIYSGIAGALSGYGDEAIDSMAQNASQRGNALAQLAARSRGQAFDAEQDAGKFRLTSALQARREAMARQQQLSDVESQRKYQTERDAINDRNALEQARILAGQKAAEERQKAIVPGFDIEPGASPTLDDAKKLKASVASAQKMKTLAAQLRTLHEDKGTELGGANAERMGQLSTAIQLEAKNIAELGALSGPDLGLMKKLAGADPSTLGANIGAIFGADNTQTALTGLEDWVDGTLGATAAAGGYRAKTPPATRGGPAKVSNDAEYNALPSGAEYVAPNGKLKRKK